jgi:hypothetical protein
VLWDDGVLLVRRSQTVGDEVMNTTKTRQHQRIAIPEDLVAILRWHVDTLPDGEEIEKSELLFPSDVGGFRAPSALDKPFALVRKALGLRKRITPRAMRRTFQDLARAAAVGDLVTRSISGHATEEMQRHYSTVGETEQRAGLRGWSRSRGPGGPALRRLEGGGGGKGGGKLPLNEKRPVGGSLATGRDSLRFFGAGDRDRTGDVQLGKRQVPIISTGYGPRDRHVTFAARAVLEAVAKGEDPEALGNELVAAVLGLEVVLLALAAREEGPHRWRRAIELAGVILRRRGIGHP